MKLKYLLPRLYENLLPSDLLQLELEEKKATCEKCAMAPVRHDGDITYDENLKCCTYYPFMPNYLIGSALQDLNPAVYKTLSKIIDERSYSLPIGFAAPVRYQVMFSQRKPHEFGNREDWLCPYYDRGLNQCGIWKHRGAVCSTFYCKSSYGKAGLNFWNELSDYLTYVEMALLEESLVMLDFSPRQIVDLLEYLNRKSGSASELRNWKLPEKKARQLWNGYYDEQEKFFKKTFEIVSGFKNDTFTELLGEMGQKRLLKVIKSTEKIYT